MQPLLDPKNDYVFKRLYASRHRSRGVPPLPALCA